MILFSKPSDQWRSISMVHIYPHRYRSISAWRQRTGASAYQRGMNGLGTTVVGVCKPSLCHHRQLHGFSLIASPPPPRNVRATPAIASCPAFHWPVPVDPRHHRCCQRRLQPCIGYGLARTGQPTGDGHRWRHMHSPARTSPDAVATV